MKILITGGTGYIGSHTITALIGCGFDVVSVDNGINSDISMLDNITAITGKKIIHHHIDLCNEAEVKSIFAAEKFDGVIHFAALKSVGDSVEKPISYFKNNLNSLLNVLESSKENGVKAFIFSSSCTVYGNVQHSPVDENTPMQEAASAYGRTKQMGEQMITDIAPTVPMYFSVLRYFNPAGAHPTGLMGEAPNQPPQNLVPVITETAIGKRQKLLVFGDNYQTRDGSCIRDYIHIMDLAQAHIMALTHILENKQKKKIEIFNLGIGQGVTVLEAIKAFEKASGLTLNYEIAPRRAGDIEAIYSNYDKAKNILGWEPQYNIDDIMASAWKWEQFRSKK